jgi:chromosome partitioning protein
MMDAFHGATKMSHVIAISNEKGGVAKTTTVLSLGAILAELGEHTLIVDLDPQANLTLALGFEPARMSPTSAEVLLNSATAAEASVKTNFPGLELLPANIGLEQAEQSLPVLMDYTVRLRNALAAPIPEPYSFILLDCPPSLGAITINALTAAELLIVPTQAEYFSAYALRDMMTIIRQVRTKDNPGLAYRILITLLDQRNRAHRDIRDQLERTFGTGLFRTLIEIDTKLRESPILGLPITKYRPNSRGALQYRNLAEELKSYVQQTNQEPA